MELFEKTGKSALGSRLRLFTAMITDDAARIYASYGLDFTPKWYPVFFVLADDREKTITEIAVEIGHSQPSVSKIIREMTEAGLVKENQQSDDKRRNVVRLTKKGKLFSEKLRPQQADVEAAIEGLISEAQHNLWEALAEWELLLTRRSLLTRVLEQRKLREGKTENESVKTIKKAQKK
ncbi:helix-turn-helix domain-containing protein [uncultured Chitinophaga sp.]|jgi:Transcriptional regulators|uniref:MarR family winged helix-turn-helix transcriptional regulator n=1 Tax=uncultured Chitinophaga sp. TaxID=339340 RepID=UPI00262B9BDF|nr:helix-turn-helix domain-containing protein [uncultured Chitinophaga sp.]